MESREIYIRRSSTSSTITGLLLKPKEKIPEEVEKTQEESENKTKRGALQNMSVGIDLRESDFDKCCKWLNLNMIQDDIRLSCSEN